MKILLIGMAKIKYMPYMNPYLNQIDLDNNEVHVVCWDRDGMPDSTLDSRVKIHTFSASMEDGWTLRKKLPNFLKFRRYVKKIINKISPDFLIIHYSTTGVVLCDILLRKYRKKYILDYRDITYDNNKFFAKMVARIIENSKASFTSSDGFRQFFLTDAPVHILHNTEFGLDVNRKTYRDLRRKQSGVIKIGFWGLIRHYSINKAIIEKLGKDPRFELHYFGRAQGTILDLLNESVEKYENVFFHGEYLPSERLDFLKNMDVQHGIYDNRDKTQRYAMPNKYYDGFIFYIPQLCMVDTYTLKMALDAGIGYAVNPYEADFADKVYDLYNKIDLDEFKQRCDDEYTRVMSEIQKSVEIIKSAFEETR